MVGEIISCGRRGRARRGARRRSADAPRLAYGVRTLAKVVSAVRAAYGVRALAKVVSAVRAAYGVRALAKVVSAVHAPPAQNSACSTCAATCDALVHFRPSACTTTVAIATRGCEAGATPMNHS